MECPLEIKVFDHEKDGKHDIIGRCETTVNALISAARTGGGLQLRSKKGKDAGTFVVEKAEIMGLPQLTQGIQNMSITPPPTSRATFLDYISGGCQLNVYVLADQ